ncbi:COX5B-domain-containing protein [Gloeophyllum trabeum ATCC 11539]|uniref:Cytochrome c oxidase subunit 4, mitochondrial n=1 Tax=Gloeophyllum trabeum (strain ATCC 11539 / FP-39264 / Madison 617) TaxID=670483 RepID=S7Q484_GLOTA|nr:COX5B-domain-containing protein [Gloeophyllum trabeum ATCC 11539]EPQ54278.1 COX5B-domain-containing protein [Gloeophyllum trabeum ATCC 11539]
MFRTALRSVRPASRSLQVASASKTPFRGLSVTARRLSADHAATPELYGPGIKPGEVPTDEAQATGLERYQLLAEMEGVEAFDMEPLDSSRIGTLADPIRVFSLDTERIVGCTGSPADSHDVLWFTVKKDGIARCAECGSVYALDHQGDASAAAADHHH